MAELAARMDKVLVVDDDSQVLAMFERGLERRNREVMTARSPAVARELARQGQPDLAIVDMRLGNESGIELIRELKRHCARLTTVLISGYLSVDTTVSAVRAGADIVLLKPVSCDEILARVDADMQPAQDDLDWTPTLARIEWEHISRVMLDCHGNVSMAARRLGIYRSTLQRRLRKNPPGK